MQVEGAIPEDEPDAGPDTPSSRISQLDWSVKQMSRKGSDLRTRGGGTVFEREEEDPAARVARGSGLDPV